jgi:protein-tyrosine phosphatase
MSIARGATARKGPCENEAVKLLFVCLGNICRSPTAEGVMLHLVRARRLDHIEVDSCGTGGWHVGEPPDPRTVLFARKRGYDLSSLRARQLADADFLLFDHLLAMDQANLRALRARCPPEHVHKLSLFLDVLGEPGNEVPDPWSGGPSDFERVLDLVEDGCAAWLDRIARPVPA